MAKKYREKPYNEVEAVQWTGKNISEVRNFTIKTRNGVDGEFYVCEQDVFEKVYEEVKKPKSVQFMMYEHLASKAIAERGFTKRYRNIVNLYERLANGGIECSMTVDDKNSIYTIYCHGVELADNSERINKSFEDVLKEEENDQ